LWFLSSSSSLFSSPPKKQKPRLIEKGPLREDGGCVLSGNENTAPATRLSSRTTDSIAYKKGSFHLLTAKRRDQHTPLSRRRLPIIFFSHELRSRKSRNECRPVCVRWASARVSASCARASRANLAAGDGRGTDGPRDALGAQNANCARR
jgi:hypothetical protein